MKQGKWQCTRKQIIRFIMSREKERKRERGGGEKKAWIYTFDFKCFYVGVEFVACESDLGASAKQR